MPTMRSYNDLNRTYWDGSIFISDLKLDSLADCPNHITGWLECGSNELTSLVGGPEKVDSNYFCYSNHLTDLIGCASHIGGNFSCNDNNITSLVGIHKIIKSCKRIYFDDNKITHGGIGLLLIDNLVQISSNAIPFTIISKYLGGGTKSMMACRAELIEKGYSNHAKL